MRHSRKIAGTALLAGLVALVPAGGVQAQSRETILYSFTGKSDGGEPFAGLVRDEAGNLYGTAISGGSKNNGVVFKLAPGGSETVLHAFTGGKDGDEPFAGLIMDKAGNLYGTTVYGGGSNQRCHIGCGTVFRIAPDGTETILHAFGERDGSDPNRLLMGADGNLDGTTYSGGHGNHGTVFSLTPDGKETVLHSFAGRRNGDGANPGDGVIADAGGNLYGTTGHGGPDNVGTVFRVAPDGTETVLYSFSSHGNDGAVPFAGVVMDGDGNLYGTTYYGGADDCGTVFELAANGKESALHSFTRADDGCNPEAKLVRDKAGNLYGTAFAGGTGGDGVVFQLTPDGAFNLLHAFAGGKDGAFPGELVRDAKGNLYGTTGGGGSKDAGTVFELRNRAPDS